jgi:hypothetical protein
MARISHATPMKGFDHIRNLLDQAGGKDGIISRDDAKKLVSQLREDGRGTEALAAKNLFKMMDMRDAGDGNRVTDYDLNKTRDFVETKMLENRDGNRNGFSQAEIAKMSPTGKALVELGRVLEMKETMGRVGYDVPEKGMDHIAGLLRAAAGADGITSRDDEKALLDGLYKQGKGTEALAAEFFFGFIDHRDYKDGARVTDADIDKAVDYAKEKLLRNKDKNNNGYSKAEIENFSTTAKAFLLVGQMMDAGIIKD